MKHSSFKFQVSSYMNKGASAILLVTLISSVILLISFGTALLMVGQIKMSREIGNSIPAYYAADAGAEKCIYKYMHGESCTIPVIFLANGAQYSVKQTGSKAVSTGIYQGINRAIELSW